jgi:HEPN domain-containing protein
MGTVATHESEYVAWQNRSFRFYVGARCLYNSQLYAPAAYTAAMAIELILKATLVYWDKRFVPIDHGHGIAKLARMVNNKAGRHASVQVPAYFYHEQRYERTSRYPTAGKGLGIPGSFLDDLDQVFVDALLLVPFQHTTELKRVLSGRVAGKLAHLRKGNGQMRRLRNFLGVGLK